VVTVGLVGLAITIGLLSLIQLGKSGFGSQPVASSVAFTSFALMLIVAAFECRSETESVITTSTFDSKTMNWVAIGEFVLALATTQLDGLRRVLGTSALTINQFAWALVPTVALFMAWELGKLLLRLSAARRASSRKQITPA
jgi:Ca2+-transporting ATPase